MTMALSTALVLILACFPVAAGMEDETMVVEGKRVYLVKPGDSLSVIAGKVFGDYRRWKEIWEANPQVKDPSLIFPGDALVLGEEEVGIGVRVPIPEAVEEAAAPPVSLEEEFAELMEEAGPAPILQPVAVKEAPKYPLSRFESCGYISTDVPETAIIGSAEDKRALSLYDTVFINLGDRHGLTVGQEFQVIRPVNEIFHPLTGEYLGWMIIVVGKIKVECFQSETGTAVVVENFDYIRPGDRIKPYTPYDAPDITVSPKLKGPCLPPDQGNPAVILATQDNKRRVAEGDLVYIDRGVSSGVNPGVKLAVYSPENPEMGRGPFLRGEIQVLQSRPETSCALVTNSIGVIAMSDGLVTW
jgi:hypothetical protein